MAEMTPRDRALAGEVVKLTDERLAEMQRIAIDNEGAGTYSMHWHWAAALNELIVARKEIERLTRERDEALSLNNELARARKIDGSEHWARLCGDWNRRCGEVTAERDALTARVAELKKERDACAEDARATKERLKIAVMGSLNLNNALGRILDVRPLGVETYPECYSIMRTIALNALSAASSSTGATP